MAVIELTSLRRKHFSVSLCIKATNTSTDVVPKVKFSKFFKLFLQTYKTKSCLMKQSYRFERFLLSSVDDIPVQLRYRELNDTQQALFSSSLLCNRQLCTPNDVRRPNKKVASFARAECRTFSARNGQLQGKKSN